MKKFLKIGLYAFGGIVLLLIVIAIFAPKDPNYESKQKTKDSLQAIETQKQKVKDSLQGIENNYLFSPHKFIEADIADWEMSGFGVVPIINKMTLANYGKYPVKDLVCEFTLVSNSGTELNKIKETIYELIEPDKKITIKNLNLGIANKQAQKIRVKVIKCKRVE